MAEPILHMNLEGSKCVIMKCNTVLPGNAYCYITVNVSRKRLPVLKVRERNEFVLK